jgi:adenylate cyclase
VGATAIGTGDTFATPFDPVLPGVEVLATAIGHLTAGDGLRRTAAHRRVDAAAALLLPVLTVLAIGLRRVGIGLAVLACTIAAWAALTVLAFGRGDWLSMTVPIAAILPPAALAVVARLFVDQRTERRLAAARDTLRRFHPPALADHLAAAPDFLAEPQRQQAAVLFVDLSGFTALSERSGPERTRALLKDLHALIEAEATRHHGLVIAFMGDGAMVVFGLPEPGPQDARHAVEAALSLAGRVQGWLSGLPADAGAGTGVRVGAHYGPVVVSRLGADTHQHITATGDSVNVASRLLEVARQERAPAILSSDLLRAAGDPPVPGLGPEREVAIRGRNRPLRVRPWRPDA